MTKRRQPPRRTYQIALSGDLDGFNVTMGAMTARQLIAVQRGEMNEADVLEMVAERVVDHDFGGDVRDLDYWIVAQILDEWGQAMRGAALPPESGAS